MTWLGWVLVCGLYIVALAAICKMVMEWYAERERRSATIAALLWHGVIWRVR